MLARTFRPLLLCSTFIFAAQLPALVVGQNGSSSSRANDSETSVNTQTSGVGILSDTQGVDFDPYLKEVVSETYRAWNPLIPKEVNSPVLQRGQVEIVFIILPNGKLKAHSMSMTGRSGHTGLDRAAWGAIVDANYPPLPQEFHGPHLQLRFRFAYNIH